MKNAQQTNSIWLWLIGLFVLAVLLGGALVLWQMYRRRKAASFNSPRFAASLSEYNPSKVGNDATAWPWEAFPAHFDPNSCDMAINPRLGMGEMQFVEYVKRDFLALQRAWDNANMALLRAMMTEDMVDDIKERLRERQQRGPALQHTEISFLDAKLLGTEETENQYIASVEFSGMTRDPGAAVQNSFREIWDMSKAKGEDGAPWRVAAVESIQ